MRISHNIAALNTYRQLTNVNNFSSKSLEKLSSGYRINRAGDDAAGLAISEKMRGQIRGLEMASKNAQDGISLIQTAEGALNETHAILQRMRELAVQAASDTNTDTDRAELQKEVDQLAEELTRIANNTEFNTQKLINGGITNIKFHIGANKEQHIELAINAMDAHSLGVARSVKELTGEIASGSSIGSVTFANEVGQYVVVEADLTFKYEEVEAQKASVTIQGVTIEVNAAGADGNKYSVVFVDPGDANQELSVSLEENTLTVTLATDDSSKITSTAAEIVDKINNADTLKTIFTASGTGSTSVNAAGPTSFSGGVDAGDVIEVSDGTNSKKIAITDKTATSFSTGDDADFGGITITLTEGKTLENLTDTTKEKFAISVTDVEAQAAQFDAEGNLISEAVAPAGIDISSQEAANEAITIINDAIETVSTERSKLGAFQNRLEHTINNLGTSAENLTAAESRIRDVDMAKEMMEFTKNNIIAQAATAMLEGLAA